MTTHENISRNAQADGTNALLNGGTLELLSAGSVVLATFTLEATAFDAAVAGTATARGADGTNPISSGNPLSTTGAAAAGAGTAATQYRARTSGAALVRSGTVGAIGSGEDIELINVNIAENQEVDVTNWTYVQPAS